MPLFTRCGTTMPTSKPSATRSTGRCSSVKRNFTFGYRSRNPRSIGVSPSNENDADATSLSVPEGSTELFPTDASIVSICSITARQPSA